MKTLLLLLLASPVMAGINPLGQGPGTVDAGSITGGPVASSILPSTVAYTNSGNTFTVNQVVANNAGYTGAGTLINSAAGNQYIRIAAGGNLFLNDNAGGAATTAVNDSGGTFTVGTSTLVVKNGLVGIGTSSPATMLDVNGAASIRGQETVVGSGTFVGALAWQGNATMRANTLFVMDSADAADSRLLQIAAGSAASTNRGGYINMTGNQYADTARDGAIELYAGNSSEVTAGQISFNNNNTNTMYLTKENRIGVGTIIPATKFHMSSGTLTIDGTAPTITIGTMTIATQPPDSKALCMKNGVLGYCTDTPTGGACTCVAP